MRNKQSLRRVLSAQLTVGTSHPSVTDAPLLQPLLLSWTTGATISAREGVAQYVRATADFVAFLRGEGCGKGILAEEVTHPRYDEDGRSEERRERMRADGRGECWQVHVAPAPERGG